MARVPESYPENRSFGFKILQFGMFRLPLLAVDERVQPTPIKSLSHPNAAVAHPLIESDRSGVASVDVQTKSPRASSPRLFFDTRH
jgi:hypothetical protein